MKKPALAFLDEATSALAEDDENLLCEHLRGAGISYVKVGHRSSLRKFHDYIPMLRKDGTFEVKKKPSQQWFPQMTETQNSPQSSAGRFDRPRFTKNSVATSLTYLIGHVN